MERRRGNKRIIVAKYSQNGNPDKRYDKWVWQNEIHGRFQ
jgi:hypothetical protein